MKKALNESENFRLEELEGYIGDYRHVADVNIGSALLEILEHDLFRDRYASLEEYCLNEWQITRKQLDHYIEMVHEWTRTGRRDKKYHYRKYTQK